MWDVIKFLVISGLIVLGVASAVSQMANFDAVTCAEGTVKVNNKPYGPICVKGYSP